MRRAALFVCLGALLLGGSTASALKMPSAPRCPVFPKSSPWNQRVDSLPAASNSDEIVRSIGAGAYRTCAYPDGGGREAEQPAGNTREQPAGCCSV